MDTIFQAVPVTNSPRSTLHAHAQLRTTLVGGAAGAASDASVRAAFGATNAQRFGPMLRIAMNGAEDCRERGRHHGDVAIAVAFVNTGLACSARAVFGRLM
jgi:hypothetical protein